MTAIDQKSFKSTKKMVDSDSKGTESITKELRELVGTLGFDPDGMPHMRIICVDKYQLTEIADRIDAEHERRMDDAAEVVRCRDCMYARRMDDRFVCTVRPLMAHLVDDSDYCSRGVRAEVDE